MPLNKQPLNINFAQGLDTKTDPFQVTPGKFLSLENSIFDKGGLLQKRNGYMQLASLPNSDATYLTTFNGNPIALGTEIDAYNASNNSWVDQGTIQPSALTVLPIIRSNTNQSQMDSVIAANGLVFTAYTDNVPSGMTTIPVYRYTISNLTTGQSIVPPTTIVPVLGTVAGSTRVFLLGRYFILVYPNLIGITYSLKYIAISTANPTLVFPESTITTDYTPSINVAYDGYVANNNLYIAWNSTDAGGGTRINRIDSTLSLYLPLIASAHTAEYISVTADNTTTTPIVYVTHSDLTENRLWIFAVSHILTPIFGDQLISDRFPVVNIASAALNGSCQIIFELQDYYGYDPSIETNYLRLQVISQTGQPLTSRPILARGVGLASKANIINNEVYCLTVYSSVYQPSYFFMNMEGQVISQLAYSNGSGYYLLGLPSITINGDTGIVPYLIKDLVQAVNKTQGITNSAGVYSQTGINLASFTLSSDITTSSEIGNNLNITTGFLLAYDGYAATENGFFLWPDYVEADPASNGGGMFAQQYFYVATYEWSDNQGNVFRSAPSIPVEMVISAPDPVIFMSVFSSGASTITASSTAGLFVGQFLNDTTTPGNFAADTYITSIVGMNIGLSVATTGNSASTPGDTISGVVAIAFDSVFSTGQTSITVSSAAGLFIGQFITDTTTPGNIASNTYITSIVGNVIGLSQATLGNSAVSPGDILQTLNQGSAIINVPTLRLTYKLANPVKIVVYRWSVAQQIYYQITSIEVPYLNNIIVDSLSITDTQSDAAILGNNILYTTGGVLENISAPPSDTLTLFQSRLFLVDSEDKNLLWFSKQVIEATPVEMSDLLTIYVAPTISAQGNTGPISALSAMDDKLIIFKKDAIYYLNGLGPDNTGANSQFSDPTFITSTVGTTNQKSIVLMPQGLMFQSDKGIWLLSRSLSTSYIGAPVQQFTLTAQVQSAVNIPGTNQIRFTLDSGITLMYDYYYEQWGTFINVPAVSSTLYQSLHSYIDEFGDVFQEQPGMYLDGTKPVLMSFTTSWLNLAGLQGYERAYFFTLLGTYITPHKLSVAIAYNYNSSPTQVNVISPNNFSPSWGDLAQWGSSPSWGGNYNIEQWRVFLRQQKCQSFQISINEVYDPSFGIPAGAGLTLSGLNMIVGIKKGTRTIKASTSIG